MYRLSDLVASEMATITETRNHLQGIAESYPQIIDLLLAIPQLMDRTNEELDRAENSFYYYAHYIQAHSTAFCIYKAYEGGYYLEAIILVRHMLEAYVQMRFFRRHPEKLFPHINLVSRVQFRTMFDEFSPAFYNKYYVGLLSEAAHGMAFKYLMRSVGTADNPEGRLVIGNRYDENYATLVINMLSAVLSGYFNHIETLLPRNLIHQNQEIGHRFDEYRIWLNSSIDILGTIKEEARDFVKECHALFG